MGTDLLRQSGTTNRHLNRLVDDARVHMMTTGDIRTRVNREIPGGKDILPAPLLGELGVFMRQCVWEVYRATPLRQVPLMQRFDSGQVVLEQRRQSGRKSGDPIFVTFASADGKLLHLIVRCL